MKKANVSLLVIIIGLVSLGLSGCAKDTTSSVGEAATASTAVQDREVRDPIDKKMEELNPIADDSEFTAINIPDRYNRALNEAEVLRQELEKLILNEKELGIYPATVSGFRLTYEDLVDYQSELLVSKWTCLVFHELQSKELRENFGSFRLFVKPKNLCSIPGPSHTTTFKKFWGSNYDQQLRQIGVSRNNFPEWKVKNLQDGNAKLNRLIHAGMTVEDVEMISKIIAKIRKCLIQSAPAKGENAYCEAL